MQDSYRIYWIIAFRINPCKPVIQGFLYDVIVILYLWQNGYKNP